MKPYLFCLVWILYWPCTQVMVFAGPDFSLRAEVLEALHGGPIVIKVTLINQSESKIKISESNVSSSRVYIEAPESWIGRAISGQRVRGPANEIQTISPKEEWVEIYFAHRGYENISAGKVRLTLKWPLYSPGVKRELLACPGTEIDVNIHPATAESICSLRNRLYQRLDQANDDPEIRRQVARTILDTNHAALMPVAWRCLDGTQSQPSYGFSERELLSFINTYSKQTQDEQTQLVKLACDANWRGKAKLFDYWRLHHSKISQDQFDQLVNAKSVWTNVLTYVAFSERYDTKLTAVFFNRLRELNTNYPEATFKSLLRQLDDDSFDVREKASTELVAAGERVETQLRRCLAQSLSAEAERRVKLVLAALQDAKPTPDCVNTLAYLGNLDTPEARKILEALSTGPLDTRLKKEAQKILDEKKKRSSP